MRLFYSRAKRALGVLCLPTKAYAVELFKKQGNIEVLQYHQVLQDEAFPKESMVLLAELLAYIEPAKQCCCLALSPAQSFFFQKNIPEKTTKKNSSWQLIKELAEQFQLPPKNITFDYQVISQNKAQGLFAQKNLIEEYYQIFALSHLQLNSIVSLAQVLAKLTEVTNEAIIFQLQHDWFCFISKKNYLNKITTGDDNQIDFYRLNTLLNKKFQTDGYVKVDIDYFLNNTIISSLIQEKSLEYCFCLTAALSVYENL